MRYHLLFMRREGGAEEQMLSINVTESFTIEQRVLPPPVISLPDVTVPQEAIQTTTLASNTGL